MASDGILDKFDILGSAVFAMDEGMNHNPRKRPGMAQKVL